MSQQISIRDLIKRTAGKDELDGRSSLPPLLQKTETLWKGVADRFAESVSFLVEREVTPHVHIGLETEEGYRAAYPEPGVILQTDVDLAATFLAFSGQTARVLAEDLIRSLKGENPEPGNATNQDGILTREILQSLTRLLKDAFSFEVKFDDNPLTRTTWPLTPPQQKERFFIRFSLSIADVEDCEIHLLFEDDRVAAFEEILQTETDAVSPRALMMQLSGIFSRWYADESEVAAINPGSAIVIPGGDLEDVAVELTTNSHPMSLGTAVLGTSRGRHALKVKNISQQSSVSSS